MQNLNFDSSSSNVSTHAPTPMAVIEMKRTERERKMAEVRKRLEETQKFKKVKRGFLTPERKKKLRVGGSLSLLY